MFYVLRRVEARLCFLHTCIVNRRKNPWIQVHVEIVILLILHDFSFDFMIFYMILPAPVK